MNALQIKNLVFLLKLLSFGFFFFFFFFPDKLDLRFQTISSGQTIDPLPVRLGKMLLWLAVIRALMWRYYINFVKSKRSELVSGVSISVLTIFIMLVLFEIGFMFFPQTHGVATTKASALWVAKYYKPVNSLGYRDREPDLNTDKRVVLFVGDSFTAGYGNNDVKERFSDIVASRLDKTRYDVYNMGVPGIDTRGEAEKLRKYPLKPDVVVLGYFFNDIEDAAADHGFKIEVPKAYAELPRPLRLLVDRLYFPNFIYWHLQRGTAGILDHFLHQTYKNPEILQTHLNDLSDIVQYVEECGAELIALMIPFFPDLEYSARFTGPVADFLEKNGATVVTVEEELSQLPAEQRVVNSKDSHSSFKANEIIAQKLLKVIK